GGVADRPSAFIKDCLALGAPARSPKKIWAELEKNQITLYRKLAVDSADAKKSSQRECSQAENPSPWKIWPVKCATNPACPPIWKNPAAKTIFRPNKRR